MNSTCYLQIEPEWAYWDRERLIGANVKRVTKKKPTTPLSGCIVVKLNLDIADAAFLPLKPEATVTIPVTHTEAVAVTTEPVEVAA